MALVGIWKRGQIKTERNSVNQKQFMLICCREWLKSNYGNNIICTIKDISCWRLLFMFHDIIELTKIKFQQSMTDSLVRPIYLDICWLPICKVGVVKLLSRQRLFGPLLPGVANHLCKWDKNLGLYISCFTLIICLLAISSNLVCIYDRVSNPQSLYCEWIALTS